MNNYEYYPFCCGEPSMLDCCAYDYIPFFDEDGDVYDVVYANALAALPPLSEAELASLPF